MSNLLGINFFRVVSEPVGEDWSQVYAKVPFEKEELLTKGGVFGTLRLMGGQDIIGRGSELIARLEERYNEETGGDMLESLYDLALREEKDAEIVLAEIKMEKKGLRTLRLKSSKGGWGQIFRNKKKVCLTSEGMTGGVIRGVLMDKDKLFIGVGGVEKLINQAGFDWNNDNLEGEVETLSSLMVGEEWPSSMAGLLFEVKESAVEEEDEEEPVMVTGGSEMESYQHEDNKSTAILDKSEEGEPKEESELGFEKKIGKLKIAETFGRIFKGRGGRSRVVLKNTEVGSRKRRWTLLAGGIFLVAMVVSVLAGYTKMQDEKRRSAYQEVYEPLEKKRQDALALATLNPSGARDLMLQVRQQVELHNNEFANGSFATEWKTFAAKAEESWQKVSGEQKTTPELFFDLALIRGGLVGQRMSFNSNNQLVIMDSQLGVAVTVDYPSKKTEVVMGKGSNNDWREIVWFNTQPVVISGKSLIVSDTRVSDLGDGVSNPAGAASFGNYIYVLDKSTGEVWKYTGSSNGKDVSFGGGTRWLKGNALPELTDTASLAIDGDIWAGLVDGKVIRLRRGNKEKFELSGVPSGMKLKRIAVTNDENIQDNSGKIAVLDKEDSRVVIFDKSGAYVKQLVWEGAAKADDLVFLSSSELLILGQGKLWKMNI